MSQHLKRWESPRRRGRNDKGRGGSARQRQRQKQLKQLRKKLKQSSPDSLPISKQYNSIPPESDRSLFFANFYAKDLCQRFATVGANPVSVHHCNAMSTRLSDLTVAQTSDRKFWIS